MWKFFIKVSSCNETFAVIAEEVLIKDNIAEFRTNNEIIAYFSDFDYWYKEKVTDESPKA